MGEHWIKVNKKGRNCQIDFNNVSIILDDDDVEYLMKKLENYQFEKILVGCLV